MRNFLILPALLLFFCGAFVCKNRVPAQRENTLFQEKNKDDGPDIIICEFPPESYPLKDWKEYLIQSLQLDSLAVDTIPPGRYQAAVQFVVGADGSIGDVKIVNDPGYGLGKKAADVIAAYKRKWHPAEQSGRFVKSYRKQAVDFVIEGEEDDDCEEIKPDDVIL